MSPDKFSALVTYGPMGDVLAPGLTKRELFAAMAMQGILANEPFRLRVSANDGTVGVASMKQADALLAELAKGEK